MTTSDNLVLVGRSSSHFTRTARLFALELGVPHEFRPVFDMTTTDPSTYAGNPALKVPVLIDAQGPLYGTENICRALTRRSGLGQRVVLLGAVDARLVAYAEELVLLAMGTGVILIVMTTSGAHAAPPPKLRASLENALAFLDTNLNGVLAVLPSDRLLSFFEAALFSLVTHLPFRKVMDPSGYARLMAFCATFADRASARATEYHFDQLPA